MCPVILPSLKRTGSSAVAVNLSPTRESLLERPSSMRIFRLVPTGTIGPSGVVPVRAVVVRRTVRRSLGRVRLCAATSIGSDSITKRVNSDINRLELTDFICEPPQRIGCCALVKCLEREGWQNRHSFLSFIYVVEDRRNACPNFSNGGGNTLRFRTVVCN